jgi:hypothetical protein
MACESEDIELLKPNADEFISFSRLSESSGDCLNSASISLFGFSFRILSSKPIVVIAAVDIFFDSITCGLAKK